MPLISATLILMFGCAETRYTEKVSGIDQLASCHMFAT